MTILKRLLHLSRRRQFEQDLADEVRFHREMAGSAYGSVALTLEDSRAVWSFRWPSVVISRVIVSDCSA